MIYQKKKGKNTEFQKWMNDREKQIQNHKKKELKVFNKQMNLVNQSIDAPSTIFNDISIVSIEESKSSHRNIQM